MVSPDTCHVAVHLDFPVFTIHHEKLRYAWLIPVIISGLHDSHWPPGTVEVTQMIGAFSCTPNIIRILNICFPLTYEHLIVNVGTIGKNSLLIYLKTNSF